MLHHYNYSNTLSHFLAYHPAEARQPDDDALAQSSQASAARNKSFTIAAILGLNKPPPADEDEEAAGHGVDLSTGGGAHFRPLPAAAALYHGGPARQNARGMKHAMANGGQQQLNQNKKSCKSKRVRTIFTPEQLERLEAEFERQQYMVGPERLYLAHTLQLTEAQVKVWFQNRRIKWRKHHLELTHQRLAVLKQQQLLLDDSQPDIQDTNSSETDT